MPSWEAIVVVVNSNASRSSLQGHAEWLVFNTFVQNWQAVEPWVSPEFYDTNPAAGQSQGCAGYKQIAVALQAELGTPYSIQLVHIINTEFYADIVFLVKGEPARRIRWELYFDEKYMLVARTMLSPGCTLFRELYDKRHRRSRWDRFWDDAREIAAGLGRLRAALIVCALFATLMLLPQQTMELLREAPFNPQDPFTYEDFAIGVTLLTIAVGLFGWLQLVETAKREVISLPGDVRPVEALSFNARCIGLLPLTAGTIPLSAGLALLSARLPLPVQPKGREIVFSAWDWASVWLMAALRVDEVTPLHVERALTIGGYGFLVLGIIMMCSGSAYLFVPQHWLERLVITEEKPIFFIAIGLTAMSLLFFVFPTYGLDKAPFIFACWCVLLLAMLSVITRLSAKTRIPLLLILTCWFVALSVSDANDHHQIRLVTNGSPSGRSPNVTDAFKKWLAARPASAITDRYPVFIVTAEGGGIRAAVMTAMVLDELRHNDTFGEPSLCHRRRVWRKRRSGDVCRSRQGQVDAASPDRSGPDARAKPEELAIVTAWGFALANHAIPARP
jgi:hypothetical protein